MKFLVTGGCGFIGSNIAEFLVKKGHKVRILDNLCEGKLENIEGFKKKAEFIKGDLRDKGDVKAAVKNIDYILHQGAMRSVPKSVEEPELFNDVNVTGTLNLLLAASKSRVKRVTVASTSSIYGDSLKVPKVETDYPAPVSPYAASKLAGEGYCNTFAKTYGLETVCLRYFNVFGPRQDPFSQYAAVIPMFILAGMKGEPFQVHWDGKQSRDFTYVDNVVYANYLSCFAKNASGQVINIACGETYSILDIGKTVCKILGIKFQADYYPKRAGDVRITMADISKARKLLKFRVRSTFAEGMKKTAEYFRENKNKYIR